MNKIIECIDHQGKKYSIPSSKFIYRLSVYGILERDNALLMVKPTLVENWELPGGGVEMGESIHQGLQREFLEETGLSIIVRVLLTVQEDYFFAQHVDEGWHCIRVIYSVESKNGTLQLSGNNDDIDKADYISFDKLKMLSVKQGIKEVLAIKYPTFL